MRASGGVLCAFLRRWGLSHAAHESQDEEADRETQHNDDSQNGNHEVPPVCRRGEVGELVSPIRARSELVI